MNTTILAGLSIIMAIRIIGPGADINGASIGDTNTGNTNTIGTGGMMMTNRRASSTRMLVLNLSDTVSI
jgi:hypothetical protein